jgi:hypothetical protein
MMTKVDRRWVWVAACVLVGAVGWAANGEAASTVTVKNETGYNLHTVKYVRAESAAKVLVGQTNLPQGGTHPFRLTVPGGHVVYIAFQRNGRPVYAKGTVYNIADSVRAILTLKQVIFREDGKGITEVSKVEFDGLK